MTTSPDFLIVNGERVEKSEVLDLIRMLCNDAKEIAGEFHNMNRSEKFRRNWPNEYVYADANWKSFMEAARAMYAARLGDPKTPPGDARRIHLALVLDAMTRQGAETDNRLQIRPNTQQFDGDKFDNKKIVNDFGKQSDTFADLLMSNTAVRYH
jgi:hypothetical protein